MLSLDPEHPRALLGLARIAFESGEAGTAGQLLERALRVYPDFPEAIALLDATRSRRGRAHDSGASDRDGGPAGPDRPSRRDP